MKKNIGLVFAGGGGKGAYQIGVWKALKEYGVDKNISHISGTSVGALNAALFAQGDYNVAENIWMNISESVVLKKDLSKIFRYITRFHPGILIQKKISEIITEKSDNGIFSQEGLISMIDKNIDLEFLSLTGKTIYATTFNWNRLKPQYFDISKGSPEMIKQILIASAAIPVIFNSQFIDGNEHSDGGIGDNTPIKPIYDAGIRTIFVVHLGRSSVLNTNGFKDANIIELIPSEFQGNLITGTLKFSKESSLIRIEQGYTDTLNILSHLYEVASIQKEFSRNLNLLSNQNRAFESERQDIINKRLKIKESLKSSLK